MKYILGIILLPLLIPKWPTDQYTKYCNDRFSFCIEYPSRFKPGRPPENDDGLGFTSPDGSSKVLAFGSLAIEGFDKLDQEFELTTKDINVTYTLKNKNWFIFSGKTADNKIIYRKTRKTEINYQGDAGTAVFQTLMIEYPADQANVYDEYCKKIAGALKN